jgi:hypothetical protein
MAAALRATAACARAGNTAGPPPQRPSPAQPDSPLEQAKASGLPVSGSCSCVGNWKEEVQPGRPGLAAVELCAVLGLPGRLRAEGCAAADGERMLSPIGRCCRRHYRRAARAPCRRALSSPRSQGGNRSGPEVVREGGAALGQNLRNLQGAASVGLSRASSGQGVDRGRAGTASMPFLCTLFKDPTGPPAWFGLGGSGGEGSPRQP